MALGVLWGAGEIMQKNNRSARAFTLIELLVVIAIIAILAAILFPVFAQAKSAAKQSVSLSNQKQIGLGVHLYTADYDDMLPNTSWQGPCSVGATPWVINDNQWSGLLAYNLAIQPYVKNWGIHACPSDARKGMWGKVGSVCYEDQLLAVKMPNSFVGMRSSAAAMNKSFPSSYAGNYYIAKSYWTGTQAANIQQKQHSMFTLTEIESPAQVFYQADVGSQVLGDGFFAGWYIAPGYGNNSTGTGRWPLGQRHNKGRNWVFTDGHAKWAKDPDFRTTTGAAKTQQTIINEYTQRGIYTCHDTTDVNFICTIRPFS